MKNKAEIYKALVEGKKIKNETLPPHKYFYLLDGNLVAEDGDPRDINFASPKIWEIYEEPKNKTKRWLWVNEEGMFLSRCERVAGKHGTSYFNMSLLSEEEAESSIKNMEAIKGHKLYETYNKLPWSETDFEV